MQVYHRTYAAAQIEAEGFRDGEGNYLTPVKHQGVWVADQILDDNENARGDVVLILDRACRVTEVAQLRS